MKLLILAMGLFLSAVTSAKAAGIDCAKAESPREKMICGDPKLLNLDQEMAALYAERLKRLSPEGQKLQRKVQAKWLEYVDTICREDRPDKSPRREIHACLSLNYEDRIADLSKVGQHIGPYVFNRIAVYIAQLADGPDNSGQYPGFFLVHARYPQVDNVNSPQIRSFNQSMIRHDTLQSSCNEEGNGDVVADYAIGSVTNGLISLNVTSWEYCHGAPHGHTVLNEGKLIALSKQQSELTIQDIFGDESRWQTKFSKLVDAAISGKSPEEVPKDVRDELVEGSMELSKWFITERGFERNRSSYDGGCYACRVEVKTIPWSDIKPLLPQNSPLRRFKEAN